jgi:hypothetical protein
MKIIICFASVLFLAGCSSVNNNSRKLASLDKDLTGTYLGVADYGKGHEGYNKKAVRIYFAPIAGEAGKYNVVLLEYVDLLRMAPRYIVSNKIPAIPRRTKYGFLHNIISKAVAYEANPGEKENTLELWPLVVQGDQIVAKKDAPPRILTLSTKEGLESPVAGATISSGRTDDPKEIFFPTKDDNKRNGIQYATAKAAYKVAKLESTWRKNYLNGPYLSQYYKRDDVVLKCGGKDDNRTADFLINEKYGRMNDKKRASMFTNPDSAFLSGQFTISEPRDGMFLYHNVNADSKTNEIVSGKIGLFIDIFDATVSLHQDVVELALIDSENPEDFLMYYEDPKNGEGREYIK